MVELRLPDRTTYRLGPMSFVRLQAFTPNSAKLDRGGILAKVIRGSIVRIRGIYGTVSVRGTDVAMEIVCGVEYVRVWHGTAQYTTPRGTVTLRPSMGTWTAAGRAPAPPRTIAPEGFSAGRETPWWEQVRTGVEMRSMPDTPPLKRDQSSRSPTDEQVIESQPARQPGPTTGSIAVTIQSAAAPASAGAGSGWPATAMAAAAAAGSLRAGPGLGPMMGKRVFGPYPEAMAFGLLGEGGSVAVGRIGLSATVGKVYLRATGAQWTASHTDSDFRLDETYAAVKGQHWRLTAGRFRILEGPVNNSDYGTLMPIGLFDGARVSAFTGRWEFTAAWLDDYDSLAAADRNGFYVRAKANVLGGMLAVAALNEKHADTGVVGQFSLPLVPGYVDAYGEVGDDPTGQHIETFGLYFPELYQSVGVDLFIERAQRSGGDTLTSMHAYWEFDDNKTAVGVVEHSREYGWRFGIGVLANINGLW